MAHLSQRRSKAIAARGLGQQFAEITLRHRLVVFLQTRDKGISVLGRVIQRRLYGMDFAHTKPPHSRLASKSARPNFTE